MKTIEIKGKIVHTIDGAILRDIYRDIYPFYVYNTDKLTHPSPQAQGQNNSCQISSGADLRSLPKKLARNYEQIQKLISVLYMCRGHILWEP